MDGHRIPKVGFHLPVLLALFSFRSHYSPRSIFRTGGARLYMSSHVTVQILHSFFLHWDLEHKKYLKVQYSRVTRSSHATMVRWEVIACDRWDMCLIVYILYLGMQSHKIPKQVRINLNLGCDTLSAKDSSNC